MLVRFSKPLPNLRNRTILSRRNIWGKIFSTYSESDIDFLKVNRIRNILGYSGLCFPYIVVFSFADSMTPFMETYPLAGFFSGLMSIACIVFFDMPKFLIINLIVMWIVGTGFLIYDCVT